MEEGLEGKIRTHQREEAKELDSISGSHSIPNHIGGGYTGEGRSTY